MCIGKIFMDPSCMRMEGEVTIDVPPAQLFRLWRNVINLPVLLTHIAEVQRLGGRPSGMRSAGRRRVAAWMSQPTIMIDSRARAAASTNARK
jgi:uncharacterized membrane protein